MTIKHSRRGAVAERYTVGSSRPYFTTGDAFWNLIPGSPVIDGSSAAIVAHLSSGQQVINTYSYANPIWIADGSTPRYNVTVTNIAGGWGDNDLAHETIPIPDAATAGPGSDAKIVIIDAAHGKSYELWQAAKVGANWQCSWGGVYPLAGDGSSHNVQYGTGPYEVPWMQPVSRSSGAGTSSLAGVVRLSEIQAGNIPHALVFATDISTGPPNSGPCRWPATTTDGPNTSGTTLDEGAKVQLDPSVNLAAISGITPIERYVGRALQLYGAYNVDNAPTALSFGSEWPKTPADVAIYTNAGATDDYFGLTNIPWSSLRVLRNWDGT